MENQFSPWSDMEITQLKELAGQFSAVHISVQIGRSTEGVRKMIKKLGLPSFPNPADRKASPKPQKAPERKDVEKVTQEPVRRPVALRKARVGNHVSYSPLEWCETCHAPVSSWVDHENRMRHMGCKRPAA